MKKVLLGLAALVMLTACNETYKDQNSATGSANAPATAATASNADPVTAPVMKFDQDSYNFGKIMQGDSVVHDFKFTNIGKTPLIITDAVATCGCTKPEWPTAPIKPGEGGQITVTYNSVGHNPGLIDKMITITANTNPAESTLHLVGEVTK